MGTFSFKGTEPTEQTIKNISPGTGNQKVKLTVTADDGTWDVFLDNFTIKESERFSFVSIAQHEAVRCFSPKGGRK